MRLFFTFLPFPPSVNSCYGGGSGQKRFKSRAYKDWEKKAKNHCPSIPTISEPVRAVYTMFMPDRRTRDIENYSKCVSDFLVNQRVIEDDGHHIIPAMDLRFGGYDKGSPRVEVELHSMGKS